MEYRRRTLSSSLDDINIEKQIPRRRVTSASIDDTLDDYTEYVYNGTFSFSNMMCKSLLKLICPCFYKKHAPITINSD